MNLSDAGRCLKQECGKFAFSGESRRAILLWPALCLVLALLMWGLLQLRLDAERQRLEKEALKDATTLSRMYAESLAQTLGRLDQLALHVRYEWEHAGTGLDLQDMVRKGVLAAGSSSGYYVSVTGSDGIVSSSTMPLRQPLDLSDRETFRLQKAATADRLLIGAPLLGRISNMAVIQVTRRLTAPDGSFGGMVLVSVQPQHFLAFYENASLAGRGLLALVGDDGRLRASTIGGPAFPLADPALASIPPLAEAAGAALMDGAPWFSDRQARYVSWQTVRGYPLTAIAGLSREEALEPYLNTRRTYLQIAAAGSVFLLLSALMAMALTARLAWRKRQDEEIRTAYRIATEGGKEGFYRVRAIVNADHSIIDFAVEDCNERGAEMFGATRREFMGMRFSKIFPAPTMERVLGDFRNAMETGYQEDEVRALPGSPMQNSWVQRRLVRTGNGLAVTLRDISELKAHEEALSRLANEDALTRLPNRHWLVNYLPSAIERARNQRRMLGLLFVDLDDFKNINDTLGHSAGDELLLAAAQRLKSLLRPGDNVARLGGDEFTVVLENVDSEAEVAAVAARVIERFGQPWRLPGDRDMIGASIGIALYPRDGQDIDTLLKNADIAMYSAKTAGKGHFRHFEPELFDRLKRRLDTRQALQQAIENDEFVLHYQPRVDATSGELCSMEALVRWAHPEKGLVPPLEFIPIAEETGLILPLGSMVMDKACAQIARWQRQGLRTVPVSVNVSARQFDQGGVRKLVAGCLERHGVAAHRLEIELTESAMMGEKAELLAELKAIRELGVKLLVDDFGTGYSSLSQLQRLDMDVLKVDRAFIAELGRSAEGEVLFRAIVSMAHALGMRVVAEGVESRQQLQLLRGLYCDEVQGYFISRPLPAVAIPPLLQQRFLLNSDAGIASDA